MLAKNYHRKNHIKNLEIAGEIFLKFSYEELYEEFIENANQSDVEDELLKSNMIFLEKQKDHESAVISKYLDSDNALFMITEALTGLMMENEVRIQQLESELQGKKDDPLINHRELLTLECQIKTLRYMMSDISQLRPGTEDKIAVRIAKDILSEFPNCDNITKAQIYRETLTRTRRHILNTERMVRLLPKKRKREQKEAFKASIRSYQSEKKHSQDSFFKKKDPSAKILERIKEKVAISAEKYVIQRFQAAKVTGGYKPTS